MIDHSLTILTIVDSISSSNKGNKSNQANLLGVMPSISQDIFSELRHIPLCI